jgi:DNA polymerase-4
MILYLYAPDFYAAVEQLDQPALRDRPVIVGGDPRKRGTVTSASDAARRAGVVPGMAVEDARALCPEAVLRPTRLRRYREVAGEMRALLRAAADRLEEDGLDGAYLEAPPREEPVPFAAALCVRVQAETGVRVVAGIGPTRFVAHLAAQEPGPGGIRDVADEAALDFLAAKPVSAIWGLGPATADKLALHDVRTIGELRQVALEDLEAIVGRNAPSFLQLARAADREPLRPSARPKSLSQEETLGQPTVDVALLSERIRELAGRLEALLERESRAARTVSLSVRYVDETQVSRTRTLDAPVTAHGEIHAAALDLLGRTHAGARLVRRLRLQVSNLGARPSQEEPRQLRLF